MDDTYELEQRAYHQSRTSGVLAGAITAFLAFCIFELTGFTIAETATWMFALSLMTASATFTVVYFVVRSALKKRMPTS